MSAKSWADLSRHALRNTANQQSYSTKGEGLKKAGNLKVKQRSIKLQAVIPECFYRGSSIFR
jgi:hypothetical protein